MLLCGRGEPWGDGGVNLAQCSLQDLQPQHVWLHAEHGDSIQGWTEGVSVVRRCLHGWISTDTGFPAHCLSQLQLRMVK